MKLTMREFNKLNDSCSKKVQMSNSAHYRIYKKSLRNNDLVNSKYHLTIINEQVKSNSISSDDKKKKIFDSINRR